MKRLWHACFAVLAVTTVVGTANAQWNQAPEIGSYQSILSRTGYGSSPVGGAVGAVTGSGADPQFGSSTNNYAPPQATTGCIGCANNAVPQFGGGGSFNGAPVYSAPASGYAQGSSTQSAVPTNLPIETVQGSSTQSAAPGSIPAGAIQGSSTRDAVPGGIPASVGQAFNSSVVDGGNVTLGAPVGKSILSPGAVYGGTAAYSAPAYAGSPVLSSPVSSYANVGTAPYNSPVYTQGASIGNIVNNAPNANTVNRVGALFGVTLRRNFEDELRIGSSNGLDIFSDDIDHGDFSGIGVSLTARKANGNGHEFIFWGLDDDVALDFNSPDFFSIGQLDDLGLGGNTVFQQFNNATSLRAFRDTEINNLEINLLRNGGQYTNRRGKHGSFELLGGFRLFQFDESLRLVGGAVNTGTTEYRLEAENFLVGGQLGARNEVSLTGRLSLSTGINVGLFNNRSDTRQRVFDQNGVAATVVGGPGNGQDFDFSDSQDDVAILGEFKIGLIYQVSQSLRINGGYRALGVGGVALAADQVPLNALDPGLLNQSNTNGSLLLHGFYYGGEICF